MVHFNINVYLFLILASSVKMVNQLLAGVHIASAAEAMSFAARLNLRTRRVFEIMQHARGYSWYISSISLAQINHSHFSMIFLAQINYSHSSVIRYLNFFSRKRRRTSR
jgi:hypothetical protein